MKANFIDDLTLRDIEIITAVVSLVKEELRNDVLLTVEEVAKKFQVAPSTIHTWLKATRENKGKFPLPISSPGRRLLWNIEDIEKFISREDS